MTVELILDACQLRRVSHIKMRWKEVPGRRNTCGVSEMGKRVDMASATRTRFSKASTGN